MRILALAVSVLIGVCALPAHAQRDAISVTLSPEAAAAAFDDAVIAVCIPAVLEGSVPAAAKAKLQRTNDAVTRRQSGAAADETVWDVTAAKGVVTIHEKPGRCTVLVYGPPTRTTIADLTGLLVNARFERLVAASPPNGLGETLIRTGGGKRLMVVLRASDSDTPDHRSQFSIITATVFSAS